MTASSDRLNNFYNAGPFDSVDNPGGLGDNGHRHNYIPLLRDIGDVAQGDIGSTAAVVRLQSFYNGANYSALVSPPPPVTSPGGFGTGGHRVNFVPSLQDIANVATAMGLTGPSITRLASFYNGNKYNAGTNPGGLARGGHRVNFEASLADAVDAGRAVGGTLGNFHTGQGIAHATSSAIAAGAHRTSSQGSASATSSATAFNEQIVPTQGTATGMSFAFSPGIGVIPSQGNASATSNALGNSIGIAMAQGNATATSSANTAGDTSKWIVDRTGNPITQRDGQQIETR